MSAPQTKISVYVGGELREERTLPPGDYLMGEGADATIRLPEGGAASQHARLKLDDHAWFIEDLGSVAGTFLDGEPVHESITIRPGQKIRVGAAEIVLDRVAPLDSERSTTLPAVFVRRFQPVEIRGTEKYRLGRQVGRGGMGVVMSAREFAAQREVAMKLMLDSSKPGDVTRFCQEAQVTAQLEHPNIVPVHEVGVNAQDEPFYTMKLVRGTSLKDLIKTLGSGDAAIIAQWPLSALLTVFQKVCDAIAFAHSRGVIHRDLKPDNVMLGEYGEALVMDWGLAKVLGQETTATRVHLAAVEADTAPLPEGDLATVGPTTFGTVMGTPQYMSPEQANGDVEAVDERSDIYSLGAILYHLLALRPAFQGRSSAEVLRNVRAGKLVPLPEACAEKRPPHLPGGRPPESLIAVVRKAMAFERGERYAGVKALQTEIAAYQNGFATSAEQASLWKLASLFLRRHRTVSIAAALLVLSGVIFTINLVRARNRAEHASAQAVAARLVADEQRDAAEDHLYLSDMLQAGRHLADGRPESARGLLRRHRVETGGRDLRGWEWFWLMGQLNQDRLRVSAHAGGVLAVAASPDGALAATGGADGAVAVWQTRGLVPRFRLAASAGAVFAVAWHESGRWLASGSADGMVRVWDVETHQSVAEWRAVSGQPVRSVAWRPADQGVQTLAIGGHEPEILLWRPFAGEEAARPQIFASAKHGVAALHWSADGTRLAVGELRNNLPVSVFDVASRAKLLSFGAGGDEILATAIDPAGRYVAGGSKNLTVAIHRLSDKKMVFTEACHHGFVSALAWSPAGEKLASASHDGTIRIASPLDARVPTQILSGHEGGVNALAWTHLPASPGGAEAAGVLLSGGADGTLRAWKPAGDGDAAFTLKPNNWISAAAWSPDGQRLAATNFRAHVHLIDPASGRAIPLCSALENIFDLAWSPGGERVAAAARPSSRVEILDVATGRSLGLYSLRAVQRVAWSPSGRYLAGCGREGARIWDTRTGALLAEIRRPVGSLAWQSDERRVAIGGDDGAVQLWDASTGAMVAEWRAAPAAAVGSVSSENEPPRQVFDLRWSPDGSTVAFGTQDSVAGLIDVKEGRVVRTFTGHTSGIWRVGWSPDGRRLATAGQDGALRVYDLRTGGQLAHINHGLGNAELHALEWSPDGRKLVTGGYDRHVRVWDALRGDRLDAFETLAQQAPDEPGTLRSLARAATQLGWAEEARRVFARARALSPDDAALRDEAAASEVTFTQILDGPPPEFVAPPAPVRDRRALELLASIHDSWEEGKSDAAVEAWRELLKRPGTAADRPLAQTWFSRANWSVTWFASKADPLADVAGWRAQAGEPEALTQIVRSLSFPYQNRAPKELPLTATLAERGPGADHFGMIARARVNLPAGKWNFRASGSGGVRVLVDGRVVLENWTADAPTEKSADYAQASSGNVEITVEQFVLAASAGFQFLLTPAED